MKLNCPQKFLVYAISKQKFVLLPN